jgi:hypothetical protein
MGMFARLDPHVQRVSGWLTIVGAILSGVYTLLARAAPFFADWSWPGLILLGVGAALVTLLIGALIVAIGAYGFRLVWPLPAVASNSPANAAETGDVDVLAQLRDLHLSDSRILEHLAGIDRKQAAIVSDYQRMLALEGRLTELEAHQSLDRQQLSTQIRSLYGSLLAVYHRERMHELAADLKERAAELSKPTSEQATYSAEEWEVWEGKEAAWRDCLERWTELAECYRPGTFGEINYTPEKFYKGNWSVRDDQFPDFPANHAYKTFRIRLKNWEERLGPVEAAVHTVAFGGGVAEQQPSSTLGGILLNALSGKSA